MDRTNLGIISREQARKRKEILAIDAHRFLRDRASKSESAFSNFYPCKSAAKKTSGDYEHQIIRAIQIKRNRISQPPLGFADVPVFER